jgi:hypothetical protein
MLGQFERLVAVGRMNNAVDTRNKWSNHHQEDVMTLWFDMIFRVPVARFVDFTHTIGSQEPGLALGHWSSAG